MGGAAREDLPDGAVQWLGVVEVGQLADEDQVDEVLAPRAGMTASVAAGIGVQHLGQALLERNGRYAGRLDPGEVQEVRRSHSRRAAA